MNAECVDTDGSYTCTCNSGYEGNGLECSESFWLDVLKIEGPGKELSDFVYMKGTTKEECPQKCLDVGDYFINVAKWVEYDGEGACYCYADIAYPSEGNLSGSKWYEMNKSEEKTFVALLPGKEWWTASTCIQKEHDPFGLHYYGTQDVASSGNQCITWDYDDHYDFFYENDEGRERHYTGEEHMYYTANYFMENYQRFCRNPTHDPKGPYCFTDDTITDDDRDTKKLTNHIEYCDIPAC
jgi:hypothetical protein